jgi:hypothetical protein
MKKTSFIPIALFISLILALPGTVQGQVDKKAAELKKLETGINVAKNNVAKNEKALAIADSLVETGTSMIADSKTETKAIGTEKKKLDKDYAVSKKSLDKLAASKDKEEATQAKTDIKALDTQYKADTKALDIRLKDATKKSTTGAANLTKGKTGKKTAGDALKTSQAALDAAQAKYDAASGAGEESGSDKKKKK